jgi:1-acyl-sn-glycerol-3-phosphate acyltransferase
MGARLKTLWRRCRTAVGFAALGLSTVWLSAVALPLGRLRGGDEPDDLRAQRAIHRASRRYLGLVKSLGLMRWSARECAALEGPGPRLVVANHPTLVDIVVLCALLPQADCIVNAARARNPFLRGLARSAGYVTNADGVRAIEECVRRLRAGRTLIIFPEGTRSPSGKIGPFQRGAAHVALRSRIPFTPVLFCCDPPTLTRNQRWYDVPDRPFELTIRGLEQVVPDAVLEAKISMPLAARRLTAELRELFVKTPDACGCTTTALEMGDRGIA